MTEQIKYVLRKFLIVAAFAAVFSGFAVLADAETAEIYQIDVPETANEQPIVKPLYRCPNILFIKAVAARAGCHQVKKDQLKKAEIDKAKTAGSGDKL